MDYRPPSLIPVSSSWITHTDSTHSPCRVLSFKPSTQSIKKSTSNKIALVDVILWGVVVLCGVLAAAIGRFMVLDILSVLQ